MKELSLDNEELDHIAAKTQSIDIGKSSLGGLVLEVCNQEDFQTAYFYFSNLNEIKKVIESLQSYVDEKENEPKKRGNK